MTQSAETRLDGTTLVVQIPMRFQRRGGRKRIVAPDGSEIVRTAKPQPDGTLVKALARAWRWQSCSRVSYTAGSNPTQRAATYLLRASLNSTVDLSLRIISSNGRV
jgi:hypothetical protein